MAELANYDDKLIQDQQNLNGGGAAGTGNIGPTAGTSGVVTGNAGGGGVSTAGVGAGGTGGWTNIQAYLNANKGDNGSAGLLQDKAGGQYEAENQALQSQATGAKTQAQGEANKVKEARDNSKTWVNQAANAYDWDGNHGDPYNQNVGKLKGALYDPYQGPQNFAYGTSSDFQKNQSALGDNAAFSDYMNDIYRDKAGGQMSKGQGALQTQLDVNNQNLSDTRQNLLNQYAGFGDTVKNTVNDTNSAITQAKEDYGNNQQGLSTDLTNFGSGYQSAIDQQENLANSNFNASFNSGSGRKNYSVNQAGSREMEYIPQLIESDATWKDISQFARPTVTDITKGAASMNLADETLNNVLAQANSNYDQNRNALNDFYNSQNDKYRNAADIEKRNWNTIMDILNNASPREKRGFTVKDGRLGGR